MTAGGAVSDGPNAVSRRNVTLAEQRLPAARVSGGSNARRTGRAPFAEQRLPAARALPGGNRRRLPRGSRSAVTRAERLGRKDDRGRMPHVQRLFPEFDAAQREFFITGMLPGELDFGGDG